MELKKYLSPLFRWWWLLVLAFILSAATSYIVQSRQPETYEASTTLIFGQSFSSPNPTSGQIYLEQQMAGIYADLGNRDVVWTKVQETLGMTWLPGYVVRALPNTSLIDITVSDTDPQRASIVANEIARQLIALTPNTPGTDASDQEQQAFVQEQVDKLQEQIESTELDINQLRDELGSMTSARQIQEAETQLTAQENKLSMLRNTYSSLLSNTTSAAVNSLAVIEPAMVPTVPSGPNRWMVVALSGIIGLCLGVIGAYLIEYLDDTIRSTEDLAEIADIPIIGRIKKTRKFKDVNLESLDDPLSPEANAFRSLRTHLEILGVGRTLRTILVFSPGASEGKSTISLNLALIFSRNKQNVILVDADYHKSGMSALLDIPETSGLLDVLEGHLDIKKALISIKDGTIQYLPSGGLQAETSDFLGSERMENLLFELKTDSDVVIIDSPPFIIADALDLATRVDGVIMVVRTRQTSQKALKKMLGQIKRLEIPLLGIVVNGVSAKEESYYHYYYRRDTKRKGESLLKQLTPKQEVDDKHEKWEKQFSNRREFPGE